MTLERILAVAAPLLRRLGVPNMDRRGYRQCVPRNDDKTIERRPLLDFRAGYVLRSLAGLPKAGSKARRRLRMNYASDVVALRFGRVNDGVMRFSTPVRSVSRAPSV